jgi:lipoprotein-releasing system ATP-binding protein
MNSLGLALVGIERVFTTAAASLRVLRGVDLEVQPGEMVALLGPSGAGKSTLLHIAGLLERPDAGEVLIAGAPCSKLPDVRRTALRRRAIGFVYQFHHLLPEFSALENVVLPQMIDGISRGAAAKRATQLLGEVGLAERLHHRPARLSGGEQQRVAIVRAMANRPQLLLADEPTGNLDPQTARGVFDMLARLVKASGLAALVATHNVELARRMDRTVLLKDGLLVEQVPGAVA